MKTTHKEVRNVTTNGNVPNTKKGVVGTVSSMNGNILIVTSKNNTNYTVDASKATIMKEGLEPTTNPSLVSITDIKVGDFIMVRGVINNTEITASRIFDGRPHAKGMRHKEFEKMHHRKK
jgi:hypothetical protein